MRRITRNWLQSRSWTLRRLLKGKRSRKRLKFRRSVHRNRLLRLMGRKVPNEWMECNEQYKKGKKKIKEANDYCIYSVHVSDHIARHGFLGIQGMHEGICSCSRQLFMSSVVDFWRECSFLPFILSMAGLCFSFLLAVDVFWIPDFLTRAGVRSTGNTCTYLSYIDALSRSFLRCHDFSDPSNS